MQNNSNLINPNNLSNPPLTPVRKRRKFTALFVAVGIFVSSAIIILPTAIVYKLRQQDNKLPEYTNAASSLIQSPVQQYANNNSVSLLINANPQPKFLNNFNNKVLTLANNYFQKQHYNYKIRTGSIYTADTGTAWIIDYQKDLNNSSLTTYYLATNIHVTSLYFSVDYNIVNVNNSSNVGTLNFQIPFNSETLQSLNTYISMPQGRQTNKLGISVPISPLQINSNNGWYKLSNNTVSSIDGDVIPLGAYNQNGTAPNQDQIRSFEAIMNFKSDISSLPDWNSWIVSGLNSDSLTVKPPQPSIEQVLKNTKKSQDFSIFKTKINYNNFLRLRNSVRKNSAFYDYWNNLYEMFNVGINVTELNWKIDGSYIKRIQELIFYLQSHASLNSEEVQEFYKHFVFALPQANQTLYVSGYPGHTSGSQHSVIFRTARFEALVNKFGLARNSIIFNNNGQIAETAYDRLDNMQAPGANLGPGSSGSMVLNQLNQIVGIYWGAFQSDSNIGLFTPIYTSQTNTNLIYRLLKFEKLNGYHTSLTELFTLMKEHGLLK